MVLGCCKVTLVLRNLSDAVLLRLTARRHEMLGMILLIVLIFLLIGAIPSWSHSREWGYGPSGGLGLALIVVIVLLVMGRI
jgi:hypothetical protein